jgi:RimJ/RimL family protein N-acetyltransferase
MLKGRVVGLRDQRREDVETLYEMERDPDHAALANWRPFVPLSLAAHQAEYDRRQTTPDQGHVTFMIQRLDDEAGRAIGDINLGRIDLHHRSAMIGLSLLPSARGQGFGRDALEVICRYGFEYRGLQRLSLGTWEVNAAMQATALACGFLEEGRSRQAVWYRGRRVDEVLYGLLADEWRSRQP